MKLGPVLAQPRFMRSVSYVALTKSVECKSQSSAQNEEHDRGMGDRMMESLALERRRLLQVVCEEKCGRLCMLARLGDSSIADIEPQRG